MDAFNDAFGQWFQFPDDDNNGEHTTDGRSILLPHAKSLIPVVFFVDIYLSANLVLQPTPLGSDNAREWRTGPNQQCGSFQ